MDYLFNIYLAFIAAINYLFNISYSYNLSIIIENIKIFWRYGKYKKILEL